jgi:predicted AAA+ superfamily ATPase
MIIIHGVNNVARLAVDYLAPALRVMPVVVVTGARQAGKTTLARDLMRDPTRRFYTLDQLDVFDQAMTAPDDLLRRAPRITLDEVQRVPSLMLAIKRAVDEERVPGQFVLTGSANLLVLRHVADSLSGRAAYITLWTLTRREQLGFGTAGIWSDLVDADDRSWAGIAEQSDAPPANWREVACRGGFPTPAIELDRQADRSLWFAGYLQTYLERDLRDLAAVSSLPDFRRLMQMAALRIGQLLNQTELGRDAALPQPTVHRWMNLLEASYQIVKLPAYSVNRTKRLIKSPKLYWSDPGLGLHLAGDPEPSGAHLENIVVQDLLSWRESRVGKPDIFYWRTTVGDEVDVVVDTGKGLLPIEVKATKRPTPADAASLQVFRREYGAQARAGLLLHDGEDTEWLAPGILATPWWRVV